MAQLTQRDKRTIRLGVIGIVIYLVLFFGVRTWRKLESGRAGYQQLVARLHREEQETRAAENRELLFEKLKEAYRLDPRNLPKESVVSETSLAIQRVAGESGLQLGTIRETPGRSSGRELSSIQFEGFGPLPGVLGLVHQIQTLGFPVVIDSLQLTQDPSKPGMLKMSAIVIILNFERWTSGEVPNA